MNPYYPLLYQLYTHQPCTRFHLEHLERGKFKNLIEECISRKYIEIRRKNENGDELYYITENGQRIVDNPKEELK